MTRGPTIVPLSAARIAKAIPFNVPQSRMVVTPVRNAAWTFSTARMSLIS
jgi:hypothetical protein